MPMVPVSSLTTFLWFTSKLPHQGDLDRGSVSANGGSIAEPNGREGRGQSCQQTLPSVSWSNGGMEAVQQLSTQKFHPRGPDLGIVD